MAYLWVINHTVTDEEFSRLLDSCSDSLKTSFPNKTDEEIRKYMEIQNSAKVGYNICGFKDSYLVMMLNGVLRDDTLTFTSAMYCKDLSGSRSFLYDPEWHTYAGIFLRENNINHLVQPGIDGSKTSAYLERANEQTGLSVSKETRTENGLVECSYKQSDF